MKSQLPDLTRVNGYDYAEHELVLDPKTPADSARRLVADRFTYGQQPIMLNYMGEFYVWNGSHYVVVSSAYITADVYHFMEHANKQGKKGLEPFPPNRARVAEIQKALEAVTHLSDRISSPAWLCDSFDMSAQEIISCDNGLLHLPSRSLLTPTPEFFTLNALDYSYDKKTPKPQQWLDFLAELWPHDETSISTLQEIFGYCLVSDTSQQKAFMLIGPKRSGKGTIARVLQAVIGQHNVVAPTLTSLGSNFGMAPLIGKRLAIISDARIGKADSQVIGEHLLSVTGEDLVSVDRKNRDAWTGKLDTRFLIISNELPKLNDASGALVSRFVVLIMQNSFYGREDLSLTSRLLAELPSILNWAIDGYERLMARGYFLQPDSGKDAIRLLEELGSPISAFIRDRCIVGSGKNIHAGVLFAEWQNWCEAQGRDFSGTSQTFGRDLRAVIPGLRMTQRREDGGRERYYEGIALANS